LEKKGKRKAGAIPLAGLDRDAKDAVLAIESKLEDLRKASMNEINRLEAMMETEGNERASRLAGFEDGVAARLEDLASSHGEILGNLSQVNGAVGQLMAAQKKL
jgi:hypothetical protein